MTFCVVCKQVSTRMLATMWLHPEERGAFAAATQAPAPAVVVQQVAGAAPAAAAGSPMHAVRVASVGKVRRRELLCCAWRSGVKSRRLALAAAAQHTSHRSQWAPPAGLHVRLVCCGDRTLIAGTDARSASSGAGRHGQRASQQGGCLTMRCGDETRRRAAGEARPSSPLFVCWVGL